MVIFSLIRDRPSALDCLSHKWFLVSLPLFFIKTIKINSGWKRPLKGRRLITYRGCLIIICCFIFSLGLQAWLSRKRRHIGVYLPGYLSFPKIATDMSKYNMSVERGNSGFAEGSYGLYSGAINL